MSLSLCFETIQSDDDQFGSFEDWLVLPQFLPTALPQDYHPQGWPGMTCLFRRKGQTFSTTGDVEARSKYYIFDKLATVTLSAVSSKVGESHFRTDIFFQFLYK